MKKHSWILLLAVVSGCSQPIQEIAPPSNSDVEAAPAITAASDDWPWWRGPTLDNHGHGPLPPLEWSPEKNVRWKTEVPGIGHASPCVFGDQVFIATADATSETQTLLAYDRGDGTRQWTRQIHQGGFMHTHSKNSHASATPACDGQRVIVPFMVGDALWVTATDLKGNIVWQTKAGSFKSRHGYGSSPVLYKSLVIVAADNDGSGFLAGLDRASGDIVYRIARDNSSSFATPIVAEINGAAQLLLSGQGKVSSYHPATGALLWSCKGPARTTANTMAWAGGLVFASGGYPEHGFWAIRDDGRGEVAWKDDFKAYVPSPLVVGDRVVAVQDGGIISCLDIESGKQLWKRRVGGNFSASPVLAGKYVFVPNEAGTMLVFKAGDQFELVAENELDPGGMATPAICGGEIFIRTRRNLYCIGSI